MIFAPHKLQLKQVTQVETDEFGRPLPGMGGEKWADVCACRCDDNTTKEFKSDNGSAYRPLFHVVCAERVTVKAGDYVRCLNGDDVRGEGKVYAAKTANYFNYSELWI